MDNPQEPPGQDVDFAIKKADCPSGGTAYRLPLKVNFPE